VRRGRYIAFEMAEVAISRHSRAAMRSSTASFSRRETLR
jgi:hypothetical protein